MYTSAVILFYLVHCLQAIKLLKSSESLVFTVRVEEVRKSCTRSVIRVISKSYYCERGGRVKEVEDRRRTREEGGKEWRRVEEGREGEEGKDGGESRRREMTNLSCPQHSRSGGSSGPNTGHFDPLANPPEDFELAPKDFDIDAELIPTDLDQSTGFVLMPRDQEGA